MADKPTPKPSWHALLNNAKHDAKPLLDLADITKDCAWFDQKAIYEFKYLFQQERAEDIEGLQLGENSACIRVELDIKKLNLPIKNNIPDLSKLNALSENVLEYIADFILSPDPSVPKEIRREENTEQSQIRAQACGELPDKLALYIDFNGPHAASDALQLHDHLCGNLIRRSGKPSTTISHVTLLPLTPKDRVQLFKGESIAQRVEQITQTCLTIWLEDINDLLKNQFGDAAIPVTMQDLLPKPPAAGVERPPHTLPVQGLHGIAFGLVARSMSARESLNLSGADYAELSQLARIKDEVTIPQRETGMLLYNHSQLQQIPELNDAQTLYMSLYQSVSYSLNEYFYNKPLQNAPPAKGAGRSG